MKQFLRNTKEEDRLPDRIAKRTEGERETTDRDLIIAVFVRLTKRHSLLVKPCHLN